MSEERKLEQYFIKSSFGENRKRIMVPADAPALFCRNGTFVGRYEAGVEIYRGIPFAEPPVGKLRWRAPVRAADSKEIREAVYNGRSPIQTECETERASYYPQGEDCLYLNLWTGKRDGAEKRRPVMVFFHGGAYGWGGTADPLYDGFRFAAAHPEVVLITAAYRVGLLGFIDLSYFEGGEGFRDAPNLGLLDQIEALRWIRNNCEAFGGDPENVTIFGESAGGGSVSLLPLIPQAKGLFQRVIAQSGSIALTFSKEQCRHFSERLKKLSGAVSMKELMVLTEEDLVRLNKDLNDYNNYPQRDGRLLPEDLYQAYREGGSAEVDFLTGTNGDETNYWIGEIGGIIPYRFSIPVKFENDIRLIHQGSRERVREFMRTRRRHSIWRMSEFYTELMFRLPAIFQAGEHARNGGKAYMYLWQVPSAHRFYGACHAVELAYVFGNLEETIYTGRPADPLLSRAVQQMWVNFAKTGDPSLPGIKWPLYNKQTRKTMIISRKLRVEEDPGRANRTLLFPLLKFGISPSYAGLDLNTPFVRRTAGIGAVLSAGILAGGVAALLSLLKSDK